MKRIIWFILLLSCLGPLLCAQAVENKPLPFIARVRLLPGYGIPLGDAQYLFRYAVGGELSLHHRPEQLPFLNLFTSLGYTSMPIKDGSTNVSMPSIGLGAGVEFELMHRTMLEAFVWGGYWQGILHSDNYSDGNFFISEAVSISYDTTPSLRLGAGAGYRNYLGLHSDLFIFANATLRFDFRLEDPYVPEFPEIEPIYPQLARYYAAGNPVGVLSVLNRGRSSLESPRISLDIDRYSRSASESLTPERISIDEPTTIPLTVLLRERGASQETVTGEQARLNVAYRYRGWTKDFLTEKRVEIIPVADWKDPATIAIFISPDQKDIATAATAISEKFRYQATDELQSGLQLAAAIYTALTLTGIEYTPDTSGSYLNFSGSEIIDYFPHPQTVLERKSGDDADLAILYTSLLEAAGIRTAIIRSGERLFPAIDLRISVADAAEKYSHIEDTVPRGDNVWLAVDLSQIPSRFLDAASSAADYINSHEALDFTILENAWRAYPSTGYSEDRRGLELPAGDAFLAEYLTQINTVTQWEIEKWRDRLIADISRNPRDLRLLNNLGALLARYGDLEGGEEQLKQALLVEENSSALINLGNIYFLRGSLRQARTYYDKAARVDPFNPYVLLGQARVSFELENFGDAADAYSRLETVDSDLADRFGILKTASAAAAEEARTGEQRRLVYWQVE